MVAPHTTWSVFGGTGGVRTTFRTYALLVASVARSVQYTQPCATSCRNIVSTVFGVVVVYQRPASYWRPGVTFGAQDGFSSIIALRSPLPAVDSVTRMALVPVWAAEVTANV